MTKLSKSRWSNIFFITIVLILIIPQTRKPIQVLLNKGLALFSPSVEKVNNRKNIADYNWELETSKGRAYSFSEAEGKVTLINFWATWCPPCIAEMPNLQKLYDDYDDKIEFIFISEESPKIINQFLKEKAYNFDVFIPKQIHSEFKVNSIPRTFLIDKNGSIVIDKTGAANWNSKSVRETIDNLLK